MYNRYNDRYCIEIVSSIRWHTTLLRINNRTIMYTENSLIFFRFTVIFINLLGTTTYVLFPMHVYICVYTRIYESVNLYLRIRVYIWNTISKKNHEF